MFRDECEFEVVAGNGGAGLVSFHREKFVQKGGPDGGDGGDGGSVVLLATGSINSLLAVGRAPRYRAKDGRPGGPRNRTGRSADDVVVEVPVGTQVHDRARGNLLRDLDADGARLVVAQGGRGGRGNARFASSTRQSPREAEPGEPGERRDVRLVLKLFAEVGLLGLPNAGKSTFLSRVTRATPKVADYPFTTLVPHVGIASVRDFDTLVLADLPGLIEGAAEGAGLGHRFLQHVERCRVLLHLVDVSASATTPPADAVRVLASELERYSSELASRPRLIVATKVEDDAARDAARALAAELDLPVMPISSQLGEGVDEVLRAAHGLVRG